MIGHRSGHQSGQRAQDEIRPSFQNGVYLRVCMVRFKNMLIQQTSTQTNGLVQNRTRLGNTCRFEPNTNVSSLFSLKWGLGTPTRITM